MAETMGERFKRLQEEFDVADSAVVLSDPESIQWVITASNALAAYTRDPTFADYVLGLESQLTAKDAEIRGLEFHLQLADERDKYHLKLLADLRAQLTAANARADKAEGLARTFFAQRFFVDDDDQGQWEMTYPWLKMDTDPPPSDAEGR